MIRVLHIMEATTGGTRKHLGQLMRGLDRDSFELTLACSSLRDADFRDDLEEFRSLGVEVVELNMHRRIDPVSDVQATLQLRQLMRERPVDVVHTHSSKAGALGRIAARTSGVKGLVHTPHCFAFLNDAEFSVRRRRLFEAVERSLGRSTSCLIAVSEFEGKAAVEHNVVSEERVRVVVNGIEADLAERHEQCPPAPRGIDPESRVIGVVGLLEPPKGHATLIAALRRVTAEIPDVKCLIVGDGSLRQSLEQRSREAEVESTVVFTGYRNHAVDLMARFEILVVPSFLEGLPYVLLEAMSLGKPVVSCAVGGCSEVVVDGETGVLVPSGDPVAMAEAICRLLRDPERAREMGRRGRERALSCFAVEDMIRAHESIYREVAKRSTLRS